jgi:uncharacterized membrane protein
MAQLWVIGVLISIVSNIISSFGPNVQRYSHIKYPDVSYLKNPYFWLAQILTVGGNLLDFTSLYFASPSIIAPIATLVLFFNLLIAHHIFKEKIIMDDVLATSIIILGSVVAVIFGDHTDRQYTLEILKTNWMNQTFLIYYCCLMLAFIVLFVNVKHILKLNIVSEYQSILLCFIAGICSANALLFGKMIMELIRTTLDGNNQFIHFGLYAYLAILVVFIVLQQHFYNTALKQADTSYIVPVFQSFFIVLSAVSSMFFLQEYNDFNISQWFMFPIGLLITIAGTVCLYHIRIGKKKLDINLEHIKNESLSQELTTITSTEVINEPVPNHKLTSVVWHD